MSIDVSVITPTFRRPAQLVEALESALAQDGVRVEVLVLDDSPEQSARAAVAGLNDPRVQYRPMAQPSGGKPALVRNQGMQYASGRYVHFLDDDDHVMPGAYADLVAALDAHPHVGVAFGRIEPFGDNPEVLRQQQAYFANAARRAKLAHWLGSQKLMVANMLFKSTVLVCSACMIRRDCFEATGGYDTNCPIVEDVEFYIRAIRRFGCVYLDRAVLHYRTGEPSLMHNPTGPDLILKAYDQIHSTYKSEYGALELLGLKMLMRTVFRWI